MSETDDVAVADQQKEPSEVPELTQEQKERIEQNRLQALAKLEERKRKLGASSPSPYEPSKKACAESGNSEGKKPAEVSEGHDSDLKCEECGKRDGDVLIDQPCFKAFGVAVCIQCKSSNEDYNYMTKTDVQSTYLLPDGTVRVLKFIEKENPRNNRWSSMKLYLRKEARKYSFERWGGAEGLEEERKKRESKKWEASVKKTKDVFKTGKGKKTK